MSAEARRGLTLSWLVLFVLSIMLQYGNLTNPTPVGAAHDIGLFELDGNADDSATAGADWENGAEGSLDEFFVGAASEAPPNDTTYFTTGGSKDENDIPAWEITTNSVPDKNELLDAYAAAYELNGELWVYFGADRFDNDGDAQIGFWFFQNDIGIAAGDFTGVHADGDVLILSEYTNGGVVDLVCAYEWDGAGGGDTLVADAGDCDEPTNGSNLNLVAAGAACDVADGTFDICAVTNSAVANAPWPFTNKDGSSDFGIGQFFEGGINLTDLFGGAPPCFSSFLAETRSSQETDAQLKDFALGNFDTCGSLTIVKNAIPDDAQDFGYTTTGGLSPESFSLDDDADATLSNTRVYSGLEAGQYTVTEGLTTNWQLTGLSCNDGNSTGDLGTRTATVNIGPGEDVTCTFTNTRFGRIIVEKQTLPDGSSQSFEFDPSWGANFNLTDGQTNDSGFLAPGTYSVAEVNIPAGWDMTGATCSDGSAVGAIDLALNETVTCTFGNRQAGRIIVDKVTIPSGDPQSFSFDAGGASYDDFSLTDAAAPNSQEVIPGQYSVSETVPSGWDLTSAVCDSGETVDDIDVEPGETVTCTFTNTKRGTIIVEKQTSPDGASGSFTFTGDAAGSIGDGGQIVVSNLVPGTYTSTEADPAPDFDLGAIVCNDADSSGDVGTRTATFDLDPGETVTCVFTNVQRGTITIIKNAVPDGPQDFSFSTTGSGLSGFSLDDDANATLSNTATFLSVVAGSYSVTEAAAAGWDLSSLVCNGAGGASGAAEGRTANITMTAGGSVTCTFTNSLPGVQIVKTAGTAADGVELVTEPGNVTYTYVVTNTGATTLNGIVVRDDNGTPGNTADDFTVTCPSSLAAGESMTCTATVAVSANRTNIATATGTSPGGNTVSDTDDAVVRVPALVIAKSYTGNTGGTASNGMGIAKVGDTLTYTLAYDLSNGPVTNGVITDTLPTGLTYVTGSATNNDEFTFQSYNVATRALTWTAATVTKDGSVTYQVTVDAGSFSLPQPLVNVATIDSDQTARDDDSENVLVQTVLQETTPPTLPPTDTVDDGGRGPSSPGFGLMLALLLIAGIGLAASYLVPAPARARRGEGRRR